MALPSRFNRSHMTFILITTFLNFAGIGIVNPIAPFLVGRYVPQHDVALTVAILFTSYAFFQLLAAPSLGALSDRYGRRPILFICLMGSAIGYLVMGIGGALGILFLGRILDGITGGNTTIISAYAADMTTPDERTRFYSLLGASAGMGFVIGPTLGGLIYRLTDTYTAPLFFASFVTILNAIWGYFTMPETLSPEKRATPIPLTRLNPLSQLVTVFRLTQLRTLLLSIFLWSVAFAVVQSNFSSLAADHLGWKPDQIGLAFLEYGLISVFTQAVLMQRLLHKFNEEQLVRGGLWIMVVGFMLMASLTLTHALLVVLSGVALAALATGLINPSFDSLLSKRVGVDQQGIVQGGNHSTQALARVVGPLWAGLSYRQFGQSTPYLTGAVGLLLAAIIITNKRRRSHPAQISTASSAAD